MSEIKQIFSPPLCLCNANENNKETIEKRIWNTQTQEILNDNTQNMGYIGKMQIEEVWKHYSSTEKKFKNIYVSNYGYVAEIPEDKVKKIRKETLESLETKQGMKWDDLNSEEKKIFHDCLYESNVNQRLIKYKYCSAVSMRVCLCVKYKYKELHRMMAEKFLEKNDDSYAVHHLDNNSYNNSVTNLIWLTKKEHRSMLRTVHPMSRK